MDSFNYLVADERGFKGYTLDYLLSAGYYRMQHLMFTCNETPIGEDGDTIPVFWLRTLVKECRLQKTANAIIKRGSRFSVSIKNAILDDEVENLYALYKNHVAFSVSESCASYLHHEFLPQPFDSLMVQLRDGDKLIATGFFDEGEQSIAGLMNMYHPDYNNYSLGKYMMLQKLQYALSGDKLFYYTGYISPGSTRFDYKVFPDPAAVEVLLPDKQKWVPYEALGKPFLAEYYAAHLSRQ